MLVLFCVVWVREGILCWKISSCTNDLCVLFWNLVLNLFIHEWKFSFYNI